MTAWRSWLGALVFIAVGAVVAATMVFAPRGGVVSRVLGTVAVLSAVVAAGVAVASGVRQTRR